MKIEEFRKQEAIQYWFDALATRTSKTRDAYARDFELFCIWLNETPDKIIVQRKNDVKSEDQRVRHRYEVKLRKYIAHLKETGLGTSTQKRRYASIRSFFESNYVKLELRRTDAPSGEAIGSRIPEKVEIRKMIDLAPNLKWRTMITLLKDLGWRIGDVRNLTWGDVKELESDWWNFLKITGKEKVKAIGFIGPETTKLLKLYRKQRIQHREKITPSSLLFPSRTGKALTAVAISHTVSKLAKTAEAENVTAHSFRKFFIANLQPHLNPWTIKRMVGKKISGGDEPYPENRPLKLLELYKKAYHAIKLESEEQPVEMKLMIEAQELLNRAKALSPEIYNRVKQQLGRVSVEGPTWEEKLKKLTQLIEQAESEVNRSNCSNGNCQRIISEEDLAKYLSQGWRVEAVLPSGKVVIDSNHH